MRLHTIVVIVVGLITVMVIIVDTMDIMDSIFKEGYFHFIVNEAYMFIQMQTCGKDQQQNYHDDGDYVSYQMFHLRMHALELQHDFLQLGFQLQK